ncbi:MAG: SH3 domain-containing protein [Cyanomargarita calcarea GSE-NOS-MK-12-04C]|jgi:hypothetical protein|uniref:SH3 domain-containing protein n=1 Tax=Cyanomargarita calcarea GSE-NOS-MK-12-04C TaxID=2839659 RepID=A0A951QU89_9CYAN|nr:SH3 domain-containing protein [Cyanomargarita calcarea GSE-NOS-MK-12-04C]
MFANILKFILGFILAIAVLVGGGVAVGLYFMNRATIVPNKPIFANDEPAVKVSAPKTPTPSSSPSPTSKAEPEATPSATPTPENTDKLPPGAYKARVTWSKGLSLRKDPTQDAERIGGIGFNADIIILEESQDKTWQKVRSVSGDQEGWVKAGNTKPVDEADTQKPDQER